MSGSGRAGRRVATGAGRVAVATLAAVAAAAALPAAAHPAGWTWPVDGPVLTAYDNGRDPYAGGRHRGIDVAAAAGAPVVAATAGTVRFAGLAGSSGLTVAIRTAGGRFDTSYLHLSAIHVRAGEEVAAGETIGAAGTTGSGSTAAPHLHFGVRVAGVERAYRDPLTLLAPRPGARERPPAVPVALRSPRPLPRPVPVRAARWARRPEPTVARAPALGWALGGAAVALALALAVRRPRAALRAGVRRLAGAPARE